MCATARLLLRMDEDGALEYRLFCEERDKLAAPAADPAPSASPPPPPSQRKSTLFHKHAPTTPASAAAGGGGSDHNITGVAIAEADPDLPKVYMVNVVAGWNIGLLLNNAKIALEKRGLAVEYNPRSFAAMVLNLGGHDCPFTTVLLFDTGNVVGTGADTEELALLSAWNVVSLLNDHGIPAQVRDFKIHNIVSHFYCGFQINLYAIHDRFPGTSNFDPENFPGVIVRPVEQTSIVFLIYRSGRIVMTGAHRRSEIVDSHRWIYNICVHFKADSMVGASEYRLEGRKKTMAGTDISLMWRDLAAKQPPAPHLIEDGERDATPLLPAPPTPGASSPGKKRRRGDLAAKHHVPYYRPLRIEHTEEEIAQLRAHSIAYGDVCKRFKES